MTSASTTPVESHAQAWTKVFNDHYLKAPYREIFDTVDHEFNRMKGFNYEQSRAFNTVLFVGIALGMYGEKGIYGAGSISKGALANLWAKKEGPFLIEHDDGTLLRANHVYDMDETIGAQNAGINIQKNLQIQRMNIGLLRSLHPDLATISPGVLQGAVSVAGQPNFDLGAKRRDKHFMQVWTPVIRELSNSFPVIGDWFFSGATSGLEYPEAIAIAAGLRRRRPDADMSFKDARGKDVTLYDMSRHATEYLFWAHQNDFYLKHEATALTRNFAIAEMARREQLSQANPVFLKGISDTLGNLRELQREVEPLILDRVYHKRFRLDTSDLALVNPTFAAKVEDAKKGIKPTLHVSVGSLPERLAEAGIKVHRFKDEELEAGDIQLKQIARDLGPSFFSITANDINRRPMPPVDMSGKSLIENDGRSLFAPPLLTRMTERERQQAIVLAGALATPMARAERVFYVAADDKCGPLTAQQLVSDGQLSLADDVAAKLGRDFERKVRLPQRKLIEGLPLVIDLRKQKSQIMMATDFDDMFSLYGKLPAFSVAPGDARPNSDTELFTRRAWLARNATDFVFPSGHWEQSPARLQDTVIAVRMQLGLEAGSAIDPHYVRVMNEKAQPLTIADLAMTIYKTLNTALEKGRLPLSGPDNEKSDYVLVEAANSLAQLGLMHRLRDPAIRGQAFGYLIQHNPDLQIPKDLAWERISPFAYAYDHKAFNDFYEKKIIPLLEGPLAPTLRTRHTEPFEDFAEARRRHEARQRMVAAENRLGDTRTVYAL